jgi:predicted nuclease of restriction endonuclease-like (RecB) superfamily
MDKHNPPTISLSSESVSQPTEGSSITKNSFAGYGDFVKEIKELIYRRQYEAIKKVNAELINLYWEIGQEIDRQQHQQRWGKSVVEILAKELQKEFPGIQGFSARNLWLMRSFYVEYSQKPILQPMVAEIQNPILHPMVAEIQKPILHPMGAELQNPILQPMVAELQKPILPPLVAEISWTKNIVIMQKCKDPLEREFYIKMTKRYGWTKDVLINNIENRAFAKYLTNQTNFDETVPEKYRQQAKLAVKDDYNFDFIEMGIEHSEKELEAGIINNIRTFLSEMGGDFTFIGNQYHLDVADEDYYIDMLLFHRRLRCLVAIDLKIGEFKPEYVGKMQFYLTALDETMKLPEENPSIGIIICKNKNRTRVEYTLKTSNKPIGVATYSYYDSLPENMRTLLPTPEEIAEIIHEFGGGSNE